MKISIITATFNSEKTIERTIKSCIAQSYEHIEYIVVDGASKDRTLDIIRSYERHITKLISEPDTGIYNALNKGIKLATGDVIGFLHSDDEFYSDDVLKTVADAFLSNNVDSIYGNGVYVASINPDRVIRNWQSKEFNYNDLKNGWMPMHPTFFVKRKIYEANGLFDESYRIAADYDLVLRFLYDKKISAKYLNKHLIKMKVGGASSSVKNWVKKWKEDYQIMKSHQINPVIGMLNKNFSKIIQFIRV